MKPKTSIAKSHSPKLKHLDEQLVLGQIEENLPLNPLKHPANKWEDGTSCQYWQCMRDSQYDAQIQKEPTPEPTQQIQQAKNAGKGKSITTIICPIKEKDSAGNEPIPKDKAVKKLEIIILQKRNPKLTVMVC